MTIREPKKILPTMKVDAKGESDLSFVECQAEITSVHDVETKKFGKKTVMSLKNDEQGEFCIFLNNYSNEQIVKAFGNDDVNWIGKLVDLKLEKDKQFDNEMIVTYPVA